MPALLTSASIGAEPRPVHVAHGGRAPGSLPDVGRRPRPPGCRPRRASPGTDPDLRACGAGADAHRIAGPAQREGDGAADALGGAGDEGGWTLDHAGKSTDSALRRSAASSRWSRPELLHQQLAVRARLARAWSCRRSRACRWVEHGASTSPRDPNPRSWALAVSSPQLIPGPAGSGCRTGRPR